MLEKQGRAHGLVVRGYAGLVFESSVWRDLAGEVGSESQVLEAGSKEGAADVEVAALADDLADPV
jgi:hypothetical protein